MSSDFKAIAQRRERQSDELDRAMQMVREFIAERDLVLYGGLAIDYALRLRGGSIYPEDERPDYDFLSPNSVQDSYDLADRLIAAGFRNVSAIRRLHVQTMGVRVDFADVADISHIPPDVFGRLPTLTYQGLRIVHPDYQRADMHLSFSFPMTGVPRENIFNRFGKDLERYNLLMEKWPVAVETFRAEGGAESAGRSGRIREPTRLPSDIPFAIHGMAAYALIRAALKEMLDAVGSRKSRSANALRERLEKLPGWVVKVARDGDTYTLQDMRPEASDFPFVLATPQPLDLVGELSGRAKKYDEKPVWRAPYMDSQPATCRMTLEGKPIEVYSTRDRLLAISKLREDQPPVVSPQYLLLYLLHNAHIAEGAARDRFLEYYLHTLEVLEIADLALSGLAASTPQYDAFLNTSPFVLTSRTMGEENWDSAFQIKVAQNSKAMGSEEFPTPPGFPSLEGLPQNYYGKRAISEPFEYDSFFFKRAGEIVEDPKPGINIQM